MLSGCRGPTSGLFYTCSGLFSGFSCLSFKEAPTLDDSWHFQTYHYYFLLLLYVIVIIIIIILLLFLLLIQN